MSPSASSGPTSPRSVESVQRETFVGEQPVLLGALLVQHVLRGRKAKGCLLQVDRAPVTGRDILVRRLTGERGGEEPGAAGAAQVGQRALDVGKGEMHQAIAAQ